MAEICESQYKTVTINLAVLLHRFKRNSAPSVWDGCTDYPEYAQYLPKGYQIIEEKYNEPIEWIVMYANETDNIILYTQLDSDVSDVLITYDGSLIEEISIRGNEAWIISDNDFLTILFEKDGYTFTISTQESRSELIKMSEDISILKN